MSRNQIKFCVKLASINVVRYITAIIREKKAFNRAPKLAKVQAGAGKGKHTSRFQ